MKAEYEIIMFESAADWRYWLTEHHGDTDGVWIRFYKKVSGVASVTYAEALDNALCFGWIDGQTKRYDELSYLQKFTPRRARSIWSKRNIEYVERLTRASLMMPAGLAEVERAKADGRWDVAYDKPSEMTLPDDFLAELDNRPAAKAFFETLNKSNKYAIGFRLQTAKTAEIRKRRQEKMLVLLEAGEKLV